MSTKTELQAWDALQRKLSTAADPAAVLMTPAETAAYLGMTENALAVRRYEGSGPRCQRVGRFIRYRKGDVDDWLNDTPKNLDSVDPLASATPSH